MKKTKRFIAPFAIVIFFCIGISTLADPPPPPPMPGEGHGSFLDQPAQNGPIDGGLSILLALALMYGGKKVYKVVRNK